MCGRHDGGERKRDVFGGVLVRETKGEIARRGKRKEREKFEEIKQEVKNGKDKMRYNTGRKERKRRGNTK